MKDVTVMMSMMRRKLAADLSDKNSSSRSKFVHDRVKRSSCAWLEQEATVLMTVMHLCMSVYCACISVEECSGIKTDTKFISQQLKQFGPLMLFI